MRTMTVPLKTLLVTTLLLGACTATPAATPTTPPAPATPTPPVAATPLPPLESPPLPTAPAEETFPPFEGDAPLEVVEPIVDEVSAITGVDVGDISIVRAEAVTWNDTSLNCPEEDQMYAQVLTDGYWVVVEAGGQEFDFRMAEGELPRLCPEGQGEPPSEGLPD